MSLVPEYLKVRQYVMDLICSRPENDQRIMSERELCRKFGVARITVRRALSELIADGWLQTRKGQGMFINAEKCRSFTSPTMEFHKIGIVWGTGSYHYLDGFYIGVLEAFCSKLKNLPVKIQNCMIRGGNASIVKELEFGTPDGLLWIRPPEELKKAIATMRKTIPVCIVGNVPCGDAFSVTMDYEKAGALAAKWFLKQGLAKASFVSRTAKSEIRDQVKKGWLKGFGRNNYEFRFVEAEDMRERCGELLRDGVEGIFSFGSEYKYVDEALEDTGIKVPTMIDENHFGDYGRRNPPTGKLLMFPPEIGERAAESLFKAITDRTYARGEILIAPAIKQ